MLSLSATALSRAHPRAHARTTQHAHRARRDFWRNKHAHANTSPPKAAPPQPLQLPVPAPTHIPRHTAHLGQFAIVIAHLFPRLNPGSKRRRLTNKVFQDGAFVWFSSGARTPCPEQSRPKDGGVVRAAGRVRKYGRAPHTFWRVLMVGRVASTRNCLTHVCRMAEGWGEDEIKAGIAHRRSLHAVLKRSANNDKVDTRASAVSRSARTCPEKSRKPAASAACTFRRDPPGFARHFRKHQSKQCSKCRYARHRPSWKLATRIPGLPHSWLQVKPVASKYWAVGCRVCRWYSRRSAILGTNGHCKTNSFVHMEVRGCSLQTSTLRRHADSKQHWLAAEALRKGDSTRRNAVRT